MMTKFQLNPVVLIHLNAYKDVYFYRPYIKVHSTSYKVQTFEYVAPNNEIKRFKNVGQLLEYQNYPLLRDI